MKKLLLAILAATALTVAGCDGEPNEREFAGKLGQTDRLKFFRHAVSGLCFAYFYESHVAGKNRHGGPALTWVPCENVLRLLDNQGGIK